MTQISKDTLQQWAAEPDCVVICGGKGTRLDPRGGDLPKSMVPLLGRPLVQHIIEAWQPHVGRFVFVVDHLGEQIARFVETLGVRHTVVHEQGQGQGIARALAFAAGAVQTPRLMMVLGDCLHRGELLPPPAMEQGIAVFETAVEDDIRRAYSVEHDPQFCVRRLVEKPTILPNRLCGTGFYFFQHTVFEQIETTPPSPRSGRVEITDVLQQLVDAGHPLSAVRLQGHYLNVTYPADLRQAEQMLTGEAPANPLTPDP